MKKQSFIVPTGTDPMADGTSWTLVRKKVELEILEEAVQRRTISGVAQRARV